MSLCQQLHEGLNKFRLDGSYCDMTIRVEGKSFHCHRVVLASTCEYFNCLFGDKFKEGSSQMNDITLPDIDAISFDILLEYIYLGRKPNFNENIIYGLLRSSDFLRLQIIKNFCVEYIMKNASSFSQVTVFEVFHLACGMNDRLLMEILSKYYVPYLKDFVQKDFFVEMAYDCLNLVLEQYRRSSVNFINENFLLDALVRWVFCSFEGRQKYFQKLINTINFNKITKDCVEFLLKKYKGNYGTLESDNTAETRKKCVLEGFSLENFIDDDDTMPVSYQDPLMEITPSIYVYGQDFTSKHYTDKYTIFSLNEPNNCHTETEGSSSYLSSWNNSPSRADWITTCEFTMSAKHKLISSPKSNRIYCRFDSGIFRAYNSLDLSSDQYTELAPPLQNFHSDYTEACETDDGNIYFYYRLSNLRIDCYNCNVDKWFLIVAPENSTIDSSCSFVAHNNLLYFIEGKNSEKEILDEYVRAYDCRTPRWLELSKPKIRNTSSNSFFYTDDRYSLASCVLDGKIYVYNGSKFKIFDPVAGGWIDTKVQNKHSYSGTYSWPEYCTQELKMISYKKKLFIFQKMCSEYLTYDLTTNTQATSKIYNNYSESMRFLRFDNVITFEP